MTLNTGKHCCLKLLLPLFFFIECMCSITEAALLLFMPLSAVLGSHLKDCLVLPPPVS